MNQRGNIEILGTLDFNLILKGFKADVRITPKHVVGKNDICVGFVLKNPFTIDILMLI
jgi:hypothetical protein